MLRLTKNRKRKYISLHLSLDFYFIDIDAEWLKRCELGLRARRNNKL